MPWINSRKLLSIIESRAAIIHHLKFAFSEIHVPEKSASTRRAFVAVWLAALFPFDSHVRNEITEWNPLRNLLWGLPSTLKRGRNISRQPPGQTLERSSINGMINVHGDSQWTVPSARLNGWQSQR
ncbi:hypothetical protein CEXT_213241 [Caerostris extrusa]|uniref:Uncharacterized protein n=1 Tax=Caerostris extrusa TaxID=172846 RepID=A0AAV4T8Q9_CAEEX|nr:hypothetical protein CEXT_213241 [Caerostris extrusa]